MTDDLTTALHELADSGTPVPIDVDRARSDGRRGARRARLAAIGGSAAAVVAVAAAATAWPQSGAAAPAAVTTATPAPSAPAPLDPADPDVTHWQFGYLPDGMQALGGAGAKGSPFSTTWAYTVPGDGFRMQVGALDKAPVLAAKKGGPSEWVPAQVAGARQAFWAGFGGGRIVDPGAADGVVKDVATLYWQTADGHWLSLLAVNAYDRPDWKAQMLKAAGAVVHADRSVPMPVRIGPLPADFTDMGLSVNLYHGQVMVSMGNRIGNTVVLILAFSAGQSEFYENGAPIGAPPQAPHTCADSNGLTLCVAVDGPEPASLTAIGGRAGLLSRIESLGTDPANWTTSVMK